MRTRLFLILFLTFVCAISYGQEAHIYDLKNVDGHLYFTAEVCGEEAEIMVESGIPALLIGRDFYERFLADGDMVVEASKSRIRLLNELYEISYKANGKIGIGQDKYIGPVFILEDFDGISVPVQNLYDDSGRRRISVDLLNGLLTIGANAGKIGKCYRLKKNKNMGFPIVRADVAVSSSDKVALLKGNLIVDFGNPMVLFLMSRHKEVAKAVMKGEIVPQDACDAEGKVIAQGIYADSLEICGREFKDITVAMTGKMAAIEEMGFLGLPFFGSVVAFDFDKGKMFIQ